MHLEQQRQKSANYWASKGVTPFYKKKQQQAQRKNFFPFLVQAAAEAADKEAFLNFCCCALSLSLFAVAFNSLLLAPVYSRSQKNFKKAFAAYFQSVTI